LISDIHICIIFSKRALDYIWVTDLFSTHGIVLVNKYKGSMQYKILHIQLTFELLSDLWPKSRCWQMTSTVWNTGSGLHMCIYNQPGLACVARSIPLREPYGNFTSKCSHFKLCLKVRMKYHKLGIFILWVEWIEHILIICPSIFSKAAIALHGNVGTGVTVNIPLHVCIYVSKRVYFPREPMYIFCM